MTGWQISECHIWSEKFTTETTKFTTLHWTDLQKPYNQTIHSVGKSMDAVEESSYSVVKHKLEPPFNSQWDVYAEPPFSSQWDVYANAR